MDSEYRPLGLLVGWSNQQLVHVDTLRLRDDVENCPRDARRGATRLPRQSHWKHQLRQQFDLEVVSPCSLCYGASHGRWRIWGAGSYASAIRHHGSRTRYGPDPIGDHLFAAMAVLVGDRRTGLQQLP